MTASGTPAGRTAGRRPGTARTREAILAAARRCFEEQGYAGTSVRKIAREADVDHALVLHFFGTKDALFGVVLRSVPTIADLVRQASGGDPEDLGRRLVRGYLERWENPGTGPWMRAIVQAASSSPSAAAALTSFITEEVMVPLAREIGADHAELRAVLAGAQMLGVATVRHVLRTEPLASAEREAVVAHLAPLIQHCLTGDVSEPPGTGQ